MPALWSLRSSRRVDHQALEAHVIVFRNLDDGAGGAELGEILDTFVEDRVGLAERPQHRVDFREILGGQGDDVAAAFRNLGDRRRLLGEDAGDIAHAFGDAVDAFRNLLEPRSHLGDGLLSGGGGLRALPHGGDRRFHALAERGDACADVLGGLGGLVGEVLDLARDHGEALAHVARARRLDGGIECEQVGLAGDRLDLVDDVDDLLRGFRQDLHLGVDLGDRGDQRLGGGVSGVRVADAFARRAFPRRPPLPRLVPRSG